ncbi:hypothetical protein ABW19_dt0200096 [Dactylella cylindrospora]|nr:hypothetical protein ABW19_dt0200096 [Dactylella cylindrospora]
MAVTGILATHLSENPDINVNNAIGMVIKQAFKRHPKGPPVVCTGVRGRPRGEQLAVTDSRNVNMVPLEKIIDYLADLKERHGQKRRKNGKNDAGRSVGSVPLEELEDFVAELEDTYGESKGGKEWEQEEEASEGADPNEGHDYDETLLQPLAKFWVP